MALQSLGCRLRDLFVVFQTFLCRRHLISCLLLGWILRTTIFEVELTEANAAFGLQTLQRTGQQDDVLSRGQTFEQHSDFLLSFIAY